MIAFLFFKLILSVDESLFGNGCYCAVKPGECSPYCLCDPYCTDFDKRSFDFTLPQKLTENEVACDVEDRIKMFHSGSVTSYRAEINGKQLTCYYYKEKINQNHFIKSYSPSDFGLTNFTDAVLIDNSRIALEDILGSMQLSTMSSRKLYGISGISKFSTNMQTREFNPRDGYLRGMPVETINGILNVNDDHYMPVLFGVNSHYIFNFNFTDRTNFENVFDLSHFDISFDLGSRLNVIIYNSTAYNDQNPNSIEVYWTFFYQKRGTNTKYHYVISKIKSEYLVPLTQSVYLTNLHIKFIELTAGGNDAFKAKEIERYSYSLSLFFDSIFGQEEDSLKAAGIIFSFGILWTIWAYYSFFFSDE